ncbi:hypothetical protein AMECASPLE_020612 [Ameca splendens]|uniref:Uncharacterized protein n=1 Tax=Ameca splendens TaxID=208324 RepID=A0ABV0YQ84_9TELE
MADSVQPLSFIHLPLFTLHFKPMHSACSPCWATSHISITQKAPTAKAAATANDCLLEFVTPVKLQIKCSAFSLSYHRLITCSSRKAHELHFCFLSSLPSSSFFLSIRLC